LLRAIGWHESKLNPASVGKNTNGSIDYGAFQVNSEHLPKLSRYAIGPAQLMDGCVSAYVAAWLLRDCTDRYGNTWTAVGCYHSPIPARQAWYANEIARILQRWQQLPSGPLPFTGVPLLAPRAPTSTADGTPAHRRSANDATSVVFDDGESNN
jgi:hypothetical protein